MHLIVKEAISDEISLEAFLQFNAYDKEIEFYDEIVPKINEKLQFLGEPKLFPESFGSCKSKNVLILEDLSVKGYEVQPSTQGFDIFQTKFILKKIALFHAACAVLKEERPDIFANFKYGLLNILKFLRSRKP